MTLPVGYVDDGGLAYAGGYGELIDALLETVPDLLWPLSVRTYSRMRWDPQLRKVLSAYTLPIRRASWSLDPAGCREQVVHTASAQLGLPILDVKPNASAARRGGVIWGEHLRLALLQLTFGHMAFERTFDTSDGSTAKIKLAERMPQTIAQIWLDNNGGLEKISQNALSGAVTQPEIPAKNLAWYTHDREGSAWTGQSLLRPAYSAWMIKHELWRVHATSIRRFGMGVPQVSAPPGAMPAQIAEAQRLASGFRAGDTAGVGLPAGFEMTLKGIVGGVPDAVGFIRYLDQQMAGATLTGVLELGSTNSGSRALGETFMDVLMLALQTVAEDTAEQITQQVVIPLVDANYGQGEPAPRIVVADVGAQHQVTAATLQLLLSAGAISPDPALEEHIRSEFKLPARSIPWEDPHQTTVPDPAGFGAQPPEGL